MNEQLRDYLQAEFDDHQAQIDELTLEQQRLEERKAYLTANMHRLVNMMVAIGGTDETNG